MEGAQRYPKYLIRRRRSGGNVRRCSPARCADFPASTASACRFADRAGHLLGGAGGALRAYPRLRGLAMDLRRVQWNLDDITAFAETVNYIPAKASFQAAGPELLKLLIRPLYGDDPDVGIRELMQNAVDACRERDDILKHLPTGREIQFEQLSSDVILSFDGDDKSGWMMTVADRGVGMSAGTVLEYFLRAGATYRTSEEWRRRHTAEGPAGKSNVLRSGRFGIGVLAAFLLGSELSVETRHVLTEKEDGIAFDCTLETEEIELKRISRPVGTTIRIKLSKHAAEHLLTTIRKDGKNFRQLPIGPYLLPYPSVQLFVNGKCVPRRDPWPAEGSELSAEWHRLRWRQFADVHWRYESGAWYAPAKIALNGLALTEKRRLWELKGRAKLTWPSVSISDRDGRLGITLDRRDIVDDKLPFDQKPLGGVVRDLRAALFILPETPSERAFSDAGLDDCL